MNLLQWRARALATWAFKCIASQFCFDQPIGRRRDADVIIRQTRNPFANVIEVTWAITTDSGKPLPN